MHAKAMTCAEVRQHLLGYQQGRLGPGPSEAVRAHLETCSGCAHEEAAERLLTDALERRLPQYPASLALKRQLAARWQLSARPPWWRAWMRAQVPALAAAAAVAVAGLSVALLRTTVPSRDAGAPMVAEAINDHLRLLASEHRLDVASSDTHQVKPWFEGRLDFAPPVSFAGDQDFRLEGGAVGYFFDRKAAIFVYRRRLHLISLFVFRADSLPWPTRNRERIEGVPISAQTQRGFEVLLWQRGDLGYALVSEVDPRDLRALAAKLIGGA